MFENYLLATVFAVISLPILLWISAFFSLYKQLQMLQQNSYFPSRYFKWLKENYTLETAFLLIAFCVVASFKDMPLIIPLIISVFILTIRIILFANCIKKSIKKLVFTKRIKRLYVSAAGIAILLFCLFYFGNELMIEISFVLCLLLSMVTPLLVFILWLITKPLEDIITKHFIYYVF